MTIETKQHTISRPLPIIPFSHRINDGHLEPDIPRGLPRVNIRIVGHASHVEGHRAEVGDLGIGNESQGASRVDGGGRGARAHLEAAHVVAVDVCDALVPLVVLCLPDGDPFFGFRHTVDHDSGEAV